MPGRARACQCHRVLAPTWPAPMPGLDGWLGWWWIGAAGRARFFCATELAAATWPFVPAGVGDERVDDFRPDRVGVAGGADPPQPVVGVAFDAASMVSLRHVVPPVQCVHAVGAGAPTVVPGAGSWSRSHDRAGQVQVGMRHVTSRSIRNSRSACGGA